jgi:hypothetical protein
MKKRLRNTASESKLPVLQASASVYHQSTETFEPAAGRRTAASSRPADNAVAVAEMKQFIALPALTTQLAAALIFFGMATDSYSSDEAVRIRKISDRSVVAQGAALKLYSTTVKKLRGDLWAVSYVSKKRCNGVSVVDEYSVVVNGRSNRAVASKGRYFHANQNLNTKSK